MTVSTVTASLFRRALCCNNNGINLNHVSRRTRGWLKLAWTDVLSGIEILKRLTRASESAISVSNDTSNNKILRWMQQVSHRQEMCSVSLRIGTRNVDFHVLNSFILPCTFITYTHEPRNNAIPSNNRSRRSIAKRTDIWTRFLYRKIFKITIRLKNIQFFSLRIILPKCISTTTTEKSGALSYVSVKTGCRRMWSR